MDDIPSTCACGDVFLVDHSTICKLHVGGFVIQRFNELRDLEAELTSTVCSDVETERVLWRTAFELNLMNSSLRILYNRNTIKIQ